MKYMLKIQQVFLFASLVKKMIFCPESIHFMNEWMNE